jgi:PhnB protein
MSESNSASPAGSARSATHVPPGINNDVLPYVVIPGAPKLIEFLLAAFEGAEKLRVLREDGSVMHAEVQVGDSVIEMADSSVDYPAQPATVHLYLADADAAYVRALHSGAQSVYEVKDQPWGDRQGCVKDALGDVWYIATPKGWEPGPEGVRSVQPYLHLHGAEKMIPFAEAAFGAESLGVAESEDGKILHATIRIGRGTFEIDEEYDEFKAAPCYLHVYVPDADQCYANALSAGATSISEPADKGYGDRSASIRDPFGNTWFVATYVGESTS